MPSSHSFSASPNDGISFDSNSSGQAAVISDVGSDLLDFGASVEFHEDHRRHIHAETVEIDASNKATREAVLKEERAQEQLTKDLGRSEMELLSLNQGAQDQFESAKMFWTLTANLRNEFESQIVEVTQPATTNTSASASQTTPSGPNRYHPVTPDGRNKEGAHSPNESAESPSDGEKHFATLSNNEVIVKKAAYAESLLHALKHEANSLEAIKNEVNNFAEKQNQLEVSMKFQDLGTSLERAKQEERRIQSEILQDRDTKATRIVEIQQLRDSCAIHAQMCSDLAKELAQAKKSNAIEEDNLRQKLQTTQAGFENLYKKKEELMLQIEIEKRNVERVSNEMDNYLYYCKVKEDHKNEIAIRSDQKKELLARHAEVLKKLKEAQDNEKASVLRKEEAQKSMALAELLKSENDEKENAIVLPGKAEMNKLSEQKLELAKKIAEVSKTSESDQVEESGALAAKVQDKNEAISRVESFNAEYKSKIEEKEAMTKMHEEFIRSHNEEIAECESQAANFIKLRMAESETYKRRLSEGKARWSKKLLQHAKEQEQSSESLAFKAEVIERGVLLLEETEGVEQESKHRK